MERSSILRCVAPQRQLKNTYRFRDFFQGSEAAPQPRISLSFKPACEQKKKFQKEGLSAKEQFYTSS